MKTNLYLGSLVLLFLAACGGSSSSSKQYTDTYSSGEISVGVDPSFMPIIDLMKESFEATYLKTKINLVSSPQDQAIAHLVNDSVRLAIVDRDFNATEKEFMAKSKYHGKAVLVGTDAVAVALNRSNADTNLSLAQIKSVLEGKIQNWSEINPASKSGKIVPVFDEADGSNLAFVCRRLGLDIKAVSQKVYSAKTNEGVMDYVANNQGAIGFTGVKYAFRPEDSTHMKFASDVRVASIGDTITAGKPLDENYFQPYQAYIALKKYPLRRDIFCLIKESRNGLPSSFVTFMSADPGQRILLRAGLLPAKAPVRVVSLK